MPIDAYDDDEDGGRQKAGAGRGGRTDFDCPSCNANNPVDSALNDRDEVLCNYCGGHYQVRLADDGRMKLREL